MTAPLIVRQKSISTGIPRGRATTTTTAERYSRAASDNWQMTTAPIPIFTIQFDLVHVAYGSPNQNNNLIMADSVELEGSWRGSFPGTRRCAGNW
ncbi:hypothetical protein ACI65C_012904 [Semiaphis heraclei]